MGDVEASDSVLVELPFVSLCLDGGGGGVWLGRVDALALAVADCTPALEGTVEDDGASSFVSPPVTPIGIVYSKEFF